MWANASESALADRVLRLHVVANSDSDSDQARKLLVRDAVLAQASQLLEGVDDRQTRKPPWPPTWMSWPRRGRTPWPGRQNRSGNRHPGGPVVPHQGV